jgi:signal transduction histidine kinase
MDKDKIVQLLLNLIKNAIEAMKEPGTVTVSLVQDEEQGKALLTLADTGTGIPKQHQAEIFNPFYTTKSNGTGLGLSICHKIVHDHGGSINFTSSEEGTCFILSFPLCESA